MYSFDASSMIHAWDNYPPENKHFDSLWEWFSNKMQSKEFVISKKAFEEVRHKIP
ncbi:DNA-binding protein, partial [Methylococcaceae bacterium CS5]